MVKQWLIMLAALAMPGAVLAAGGWAGKLGRSALIRSAGEGHAVIADLEKLYTFGRFLRLKLPSDQEGPLKLDDEDAQREVIVEPRLAPDRRDSKNRRHDEQTRDECGNNLE